MTPFFQDHLRRFKKNTKRSYRIRPVHEGGTEGWMALYYEAHRVVIELSPHPAYAVVLWRSKRNHARQIFFSNADFSHADERSAAAILYYLANRGALSFQERPLR